MRKFRFIILAVLFVITIGGLVVLNNDSQVHSSHLDGSDFKPGRIIDDSVMANSSTMDTAQIQRFLENKVRGGSCDTWGERDHTTSTEAPYTCLYEYKQNPDTGEDNYGDNPTPSGAIPASRIIYNASQKYDINPQALLVLLQKEQGLITDDWPWEYQYRSATGFGCPDTAECDEEYYGFYNQVDQAAKYFRDFLDDTRGYNYYPPGNNDILYHPDHSCGSSQVNIENRATSALYNYTPYQPNQAALDYLYTAASGSGSECAAYGNRNFWRDFTEWFGSTTIPQTIKIKGDSNPDRVYLVWQDYYYHIGSSNLLRALNLDGQTHPAVSKSELDGFEQGPRLNFLAKFEDNSDPVYQIDDRRLYHYTSREMLEEDYQAGKAGGVTVYPETLRDFFQDQRKMGVILRAHGKDTAYSVENGRKRHIISGEAYRSLGDPVYSERSSVRLSSRFVNGLNDGPPIMRNNRILKTSDTGQYYLYDHDQTYPASSAAFSAWGQTVNYSRASAELLEELPASTEEVGITVRHNDNLYLIVNGDLRPIDSQTREAWQLEGGFVDISDSFRNRFEAGAAVTDLIRINGNSAVYKVHNGQYHHIATRKAFDSYGYDMADVMNVGNIHANELLSDGVSTLHAPGQLIRRGNENPVYIVVDEFQRRYIPSREIFESYRFSFKEVRSTDAMTGYEQLEDLGNLATYNGNTWLVDRGNRYKADSDVLDSSGYDWSDEPRNEILSQTFEGLNNGGDLDIYVRGVSNPDPVFKIENGQKRQYSSRSSFEEGNGDWGSIIQLSDSILDSFPAGNPI